VVAIGGNTTKNAHQVLAAGADMVAVMSDLFDAMDIRSQAEKFQKLFNHS
jgi:thiamine-phosphate pyrophosphorylase